MVVIEDLYIDAQKIKPWQLDLRRWLHQHPELQFSEFNTSARLQQELNQLGIPFTTMWGKMTLADGTKVGGTGVVAQIGTGKSPCVALRADIDALPVTEMTGLSYSSLNEGCMHACGHDAHMAIVMGAASILKKHEGLLKGTVRLIFQPAEEGSGGAKYMIDEGVLDMQPNVQSIFGLHMFPFNETGEIWSRPGPLLGGSVRFTIQIKGLGGHASMPHLTKDPVSTAAAMILNINNFVARGVSVVDERKAGVISVTSVSSPVSHNVIPPYTELRGTIRSLHDDQMEYLRSSLTKIVNHTVEMYGLTATLQYEGVAYPVTYNNDELFHWAEQELSNNSVIKKGLQRNKPIMGAEDFSFYGAKVPACFFFLGAGPPGAEEVAGLHNNKFVIEESSMPIGSATLAYLAIRRLETLQQSTQQD